MSIVNGASGDAEKRIEMMQDLKKKPSVFIAIFVEGERDGWLCPSIAPFLVSLTQQNGRAVSLQIRALKRIDYARNCVVKDFLASGFEWLLMIDNDMAPPPGLLDMIDRAEAHMDILVPKFYTIRTPTEAPESKVGLFLSWQFFAGSGKKPFCVLRTRPNWIRASPRRHR